MELRLLTDDDIATVTPVLAEAFGASVELTTIARPGSTRWGMFDGDRLVATALHRRFSSWFGGELVPTCGIAGVAIPAEDRGRGLIRPLIGALLDEARSEGARISTMFPTAAGVYTSLGYEQICALDIVSTPTVYLAPFRRNAAVRRATEADLPALRALHDQWARTRQGPLARTDLSYAGSPEWFTSFTGVTIAEDDQGAPTGYVAWKRGDGYGQSAKIEADELLALDDESTSSLLAVLGSFSSVTGTVRLRTCGDDLARWIPDGHIVERLPYLLKVLDADQSGREWARRFGPERHVIDYF